MDAQHLRQVRDKLLDDIAREGINPGMNKRQIEAALQGIANHRSVAANRNAMRGALPPGLSVSPLMEAKLWAAVLAKEEAIEREVNPPGRGRDGT